MTRSGEPDAYKVFYECIRRPLLVYRWIGLLPIEGLSNHDSNETSFNLKSAYTIIYVKWVFLLSMSTALVYHFRLMKITSVVKDSWAVLVISSTVLLLIVLFRICKKWKSSINEIESIELLLPPLGNYKMIITRVNWLIGIMLILFLMHNVTYYIYEIMIVKQCHILEDDSGWYVRSYLISSCQWCYYYMPFNYTFGCILQLLKLQGSLMAYQTDFMIVIITGYLSYRFKNFYRTFVQTIKNKPGRRIPWHEIQAHYTRLTKLVLIVDDLISPFIFTAFLSHLLLICKQIYDVIQRETVVHMFQTTKCALSLGDNAVSVFFLFLSTVILLLRSLMVSLMTAHLHTLSREPLNALHTVSPSVYNNEMQKLMDQVYNSKVCLSGLKFFFVTRGTVLSMISTILTYELVLLQIRD